MQPISQIEFANVADYLTVIYKFKIDAVAMAGDVNGDGFDDGESFTMDWQLGGVLVGQGQLTLTQDTSTTYSLTGAAAPEAVPSEQWSQPAASSSPWSPWSP